MRTFKATFGGVSPGRASHGQRDLCPFWDVLGQGYGRHRSHEELMATRQRQSEQSPNRTCHPTKRIHFMHFRRLLGNPPIHSLTVEALDRYRGQRREEGVGPATLNRELGTLKHALTKAVEWKLLRPRPATGATAVKKLPEPDGRFRYLSGPEEARRLIDACDPWLGPLS